LKAIKLRIIRMVSPDGIVSVLLTNLYDTEKFPRQEIITLSGVFQTGVFLACNHLRTQVNRSALVL